MINNKMIKNKIALITGASRGIGRAIATEFAKNNANVIINYNNDRNSALTVEQEIKKFGRNAMSIKADVSKYHEVSSMMQLIKNEFGRIDILVNNAGITMDRTLKNMTQEEWNRVIDVNLNSIYNVTKQALPLIPRHGRIINITSTSGIAGNFGQCNYAASKAGIIGFTKSLAKELGKYQITVNAIAPGFIETEMIKKIPFFKKRVLMYLIPLGRVGQKEEVAHCVLFLASEKATYITGEVLNVNGGLGW